MADEMEKQTKELKRQTKAVSEMTDQIKGMSTDLVVSQATLARTYQQGLSDVSNQLGQGFSGVSRELGQMTAAFSFGLNRVSNGLNVMAHSLNFMSDTICKRLDALHNIANNPLLTQTQELYRRALVNYNKGFFEEALDDVKQAIEKYKTDYMSWFLMGHIYAFGEGEFSNVINLEQAINAFTQAAKYNSPNVTASQDARLLAAEIYFYWGTTQYLQSKALLKTGKKEESAEMLAGALTSFGKSFQYSDKMLEALFNSARCKVIQNQTNAAIADLEELILLDRDYCLRVCNDTDFAGIKNEIEALIIKMRHSVFIEAEPKYNKIKNLIADCDTMNIATYSYKIPSQFTEELPYFDVLDYNDEFDEMIPQIEATIRKTKEQNRRKEQERIEQAEQARRDAEDARQNAEWARQREIREQKKEASNKRLLILSFALLLGGIASGIVLGSSFFPVVGFISGGIMTLIRIKEHQADKSALVFSLLLMTGGIASGIALNSSFPPALGFIFGGIIKAFREEENRYFRIVCLYMSPICFCIYAGTDSGWFIFFGIVFFVIWLAIKIFRDWLY